ncbi:MAG: conjugal transfer protein TraX, partial [Oribacterium sp.]|nr:conjugal transfer protein TraX [Oribacterium sp.]
LIIHVISLGSFRKGVSTTCGFVLAAILITRFYDESKPIKSGTEEKGYIASTLKKYFFYIFYPLHLVILSGVYKLLID